MQELEKKDLPVRIKERKNQAVQMLGVKSMKCLYCKETFFRHWIDRVVNKQIKCPHCGEVHVNKSSKKFDLRKFDPNKDELYIPTYE